MNTKTAIVAASLVALAAITVYLGNQLGQTRGDLAALRARFEAAETDRAGQAEATGARLDGVVVNIAAQAEATARLGSPEQIASLVVADRFPALVEAVAAALTADPAKVAALRGEQGPAPELTDLVDTLYSYGLVEDVSNSIWQDRNRELAAMPETIANVAAEVYQTYGASLRGQTIPAKEVAAALALDPGFVALVELELGKNAVSP